MECKNFSQLPVLEYMSQLWKCVILQTRPYPPSPSLFASEKLSVAVNILLKLNDNNSPLFESSTDALELASSSCALRSTLPGFRVISEAKPCMRNYKRKSM
ncbi:hypothetical protein CsSME_00027133 [Camellia sinensis var. sinensis]